MNKKVLLFALLVGILPPAWAVLSGHIGVSVGPVALITAGIYNADPNHKKNIWKHCLGLLFGDLWSLLSCLLIGKLPFSPDVSVYLTLFIFGIVAIFLATALEAYVFLPCWLSGWAIGMTILNLNDASQMFSLTIQIAISMLVGVWYVGALLNWILQKFSND
jgi:hypothetical protein